MRSIGSPRLLKSQTAPKPTWQTTRLSSASIVSPSGPEPPDIWIYVPTLLTTAPSLTSGQRQMALARVTARKRAVSALLSTRPLGERSEGRGVGKEGVGRGRYR